MTKRNPSANVVQDLYVATRQEEMELTANPQRKRASNKLCELLLANLDPKKKQKIPGKELKRVYRTIEQNLQSADLTINFPAESWFTSENNYDTYTQMYERAMKGDTGDTMRLKSTALNDARTRAQVDDSVTFPKSWYGAKAATDAKEADKDYVEAFKRGNPGVHGGLSPNRQGTERIMRQMEVGPLRMAGATAAEGYSSTAKYFNPHTKQLFFGLNYGRRPHGPAADYGQSYMVIKADLKPKCFYYAIDTFVCGSRGLSAQDLQYSYDNLGAIIGDPVANGLMKLIPDIMESCYRGNALPDTGVGNDMMYVLIEAHYFGELRFRDHVQYVAISPKKVANYTDALWQQIVGNATKFCNRHGIPLYIKRD